MNCETCGTPLENGACPQCSAQAAPVAPGAPANAADFAGNGKIFSILAYLGVLFLVGMFVPPEKDDPRVRFHVGQGMLVLGAWIAIGILMFIFTIVFGLMGRFGIVVGLFFDFVLYVAALGLSVMGIINVVRNKDVPLPLIGKLAFYK